MTSVYIAGFDGLYSVDETGAVFSHRSGVPKPMKGGLTTKGYRQVCLTKDGKQYMKQVHRLVAEAFIPNPLGLATVNHKDKCKTNNKVDNLEWLSNADNIAHGQAKSYRLYHEDGEVIDIRNLNEFCRLMCIGQGNLMKLAAGKINRCYGFVKVEAL